MYGNLNKLPWSPFTQSSTGYTWHTAITFSSEGVWAKWCVIFRLLLMAISGFGVSGEYACQSKLSFFEHAVIVPFLVHLTYKTGFLVFPLVQPAATPSKHNTTFTRSQNLQTPVAALLLYLPQTCSGFGFPVCRCSLVQFVFPQPFLERCYVTHWLLGEMLRTWRDVTVATILLLLSQILQHIKLLSPDEMTSFAEKLKGTPLLKGFH